jgi:hypothetical protein
MKISEAARLERRGDKRVADYRQINAKQDRESELKERARAHVTLAVKSWQDMHSRPLPSPRPALPSYVAYRSNKSGTGMSEAASPPPNHPHYRPTSRGGKWNANPSTNNAGHTPRPPPSARPPTGSNSGRPSSGRAREGRGVGGEQRGGSIAVPSGPVPTILRLLRHLHEVCLFVCVSVYVCMCLCVCVSVSWRSSYRNRQHDGHTHGAPLGVSL